MFIYSDILDYWFVIILTRQCWKLFLNLQRPGMIKEFVETKFYDIIFTFDLDASLDR